MTTPTKLAERRHTHPHQKKHATGVSLIEVLIVIVLFSFGLLGMVGLQARAVQVSVSAEDSNRAALLANEMASAMWMTGNVNLPAGDVTAWRTRVAATTGAGLPNGDGSVVVTGPVARITVTWRAPDEPATASHRYVTEVVLP
jgi:type IV pilus assembly protein PilV